MPGLFLRRHTDSYTFIKTAPNWNFRPKNNKFYPPFGRFWPFFTDINSFSPCFDFSTFVTLFRAFSSFSNQFTTPLIFSFIKRLALFGQFYLFLSNLDPFCPFQTFVSYFSVFFDPIFYLFHHFLSNFLPNLKLLRQSIYKTFWPLLALFSQFWPALT